MEEKKEKKEEKEEQLKDVPETIEEVKEDEVKETLKGMMEEIKNLKKDRDILMQSADKRALARYYARNRGDMPPVVSLRSMEVVNKDGIPETKVIVGWRMILDKGSYQVPGTGKWTEYQEVEVIYEDGTSEKMQEMDFERRHEKNIRAEVLSVITDNITKEEALKVRRSDNGKELTIGVKYIN